MNPPQLRIQDEDSAPRNWDVVFYTNGWVREHTIISFTLTSKVWSTSRINGFRTYIYDSVGGEVEIEYKAKLTQIFPNGLVSVMSGTFQSPDAGDLRIGVRYRCENSPYQDVSIIGSFGEQSVAPQKIFHTNSRLSSSLDNLSLSSSSCSIGSDWLAISRSTSCPADVSRGK